MEPLDRTPQEVAEDREFFARYGDWAPLDPLGLADFMAGFDRPWWIVGGWAIEAFTGLAPDRRAWLRDAVGRLYPGHHWLRVLG